MLVDILTDSSFVLIHFFLVVGNYFLFGKKIAHPALLFSLLWFVIICLHIFFRLTFLNRLYPLSDQLHLILVSGVLFFSFGGWVTSAINNNNNKPTQDNSTIELNLFLRILVTAVVIIGLPFYIQATYQIFLESNKEEFFTGVRNEIYEGERAMGITKYLTSLSFVTFGVNLFSFYRKKGKIEIILLILSTICVLGYSLFATGRVFFLFLVSIYIGVKSMSKTKTPVWHFIFIFLTFILAFMLLGIIYGKGANLYSSLSENIPLAIEGVGMYTVAPLNALDTQINTNDFLITNGDYTLRFFLKIAMEFGFIPQRNIQSLIQDYAFVPYPTNVYTYYQPYIRDFGLLYSLIMLMIFGALHSWVYKKAVKLRSIRFVLYFSFLLYPLFMTFFNDVYMVGFSFLFQLLVYVEIILFINKFFYAKTNDRFKIDFNG